MPNKDLENICKQIVEAPRNDENLIKLRELALDGNSRKQAREVCFEILKNDSNVHRVRLILAKTFYLDQMPQFCVKELLHLKAKTGGSKALDKLLDSFADLAPKLIDLFASLASGEDAEKGNGSKKSDEAESEQVVAELDIDVDIGEVFDDIDTE